MPAAIIAKSVRRVRRAAFAILNSTFVAAAGAAEHVAIFVDGIDPVVSLAQVTSGLTGPAQVRTTSYLMAESPIPGLIRNSIPDQRALLWNGSLADSQGARDAVVKLESMICQQRGKTVHLITHSLGTVIAYTALAELAGIGGSRSTPACGSTAIGSLVTLGSPIGRADFLPRYGAYVSGLQIPSIQQVQSRQRLRIVERWLNVYATYDPVGARIDMPSVVNVPLATGSSFQPIDAHNFPWRDADAARLVADTVLGARAQLELAAQGAAGVASAPTTAIIPAYVLVPPSAAPVAQPIAAPCRGSKSQRGLSGLEAAAALGSLREAERTSAITSLARSSGLMAPLSPREVPALLASTTGNYRAAAIAEIATVLKGCLTGAELAAVLGAPEVLAEQPRASAITAIARNARVDKSMRDDASLALRGLTGANRANAISELAASLDDGLSGQEISRILGDQNELAEQPRLSAITALARARRNRPGLTGDELALVLQYMSGPNRAAAISELSWR